METTRVDRWLWSVRLFPTRSAATAACRGGHVRVNDTVAKPSSPVRTGDVLAVRRAGRDRIVEVARVIDTRVGAPIAAECLIDRSPPRADTPPVEPFVVRDRGAGRPTKRDRRQIDRTRGRR